MLVRALLVIFLVNPQVFAYRFLCNGLEADGSEASDRCGPCTDESAPRWIPSSVDVLVDLKTLPKQLNESTWRNVVESSLETWNQVPGSNIRLRFVGESSHRRFGTDPNKHEIFWVLDKQEWREKVGSGENGTLGVTVSPYQCPAKGRKSREIYDADLIMNGLGKIKWRIDCRNEEGCESIRATLIHELGHFIGIGHPCTDCEWSIMAASSGTNERLARDDHEAVRSLYPSSHSGLMGMHCATDAECSTGLCLNHSETRYCSKRCDREACPDGFTCDEGAGVCRFAHGRLAPVAGVRERCETRPCGDGMQCVETVSDKNFCLKTCLKKTDCPSMENCMLFEDGGAGVCLLSASLNQSCGDLTSCDDKLVCVGRKSNEGICRPSCDPKKKRQCRNEGVCKEVEKDIWACVP